LYQCISLALLSVASVLIFAIAELITHTLNAYDVQALYISFVAGFILLYPCSKFSAAPFNTFEHF